MGTGTGIITRDISCVSEGDSETTVERFIFLERRSTNHGAVVAGWYRHDKGNKHSGKRYSHRFLFPFKIARPAFLKLYVCVFFVSIKETQMLHTINKSVTKKL